MQRSLIAFFLCMMFVSPAVAVASDVPAQFAWPLMQWISVKTGIQVDTLPAINVSRDMMVARIGDPQRQSAMARALYVPNQVVLDDQFWDATDTRKVSFLLHELVHHAQLVSGKKYPCANAKEWEAYRLQNMWLEEKGLAPAVSEEWIATMAACHSPVRREYGGH
jgi:hypothetical protein